MGKRANEFTLRRGNCSTTFEFGPNNPFAFSTRTEKASLPLVLQTTTGLSGTLRLEVAPTITRNEESGEVRIRDSYRAVDDEDKPLDPAVYVARVLRLKAGQCVFEKPSNGPEPTDITMQFSHPNSTTWPEPGIELDGLPVWTNENLTMSSISIDGAIVMTCREKANQALLAGPSAAPSAPASARHTIASSSTAVYSISGASRASLSSWRRPARAAAPRSSPAHETSTDWRSPAAADQSDPTPRRAPASIIGPSLEPQLGGVEHEKEDRSIPKAITEASREDHSGISAAAIRIGRKRGLRLDLDNPGA